MTIHSSLGSPAARQATIARDVLESIMLDLQSLPGFVDRRQMASAVEKAMAALVKLIDHNIDAADHLDLLTRAQESVKYARQIVSDQVHGTAAERYVRTIEGVEQALDASREATIEKIVRRQHALDDPSPPSQTYLGGSFLGSTDRPRLQCLKREPLETLVQTDVLRALAEERVESMAAPSGRDDEEGLDLTEAPYQPEDWYGHVAIKHDRDGLHRLELITERGASDEMPETIPGIEGEIASALRQLRDCLEELGNVGNLRMLKPDERFDEGAIAFEQRLLTNFDAIIALSLPFYLSSGNCARYDGINILREVLSYARGAFTVDTVRTFATAFVLCCVEGHDTVRAAVLALRQSHRLTHSAQAEAFSLATSTAIAPAMHRLCQDENNDMIVVALTVLSRRGEVDIAAAIPLLEHNDGIVRAAAARCLAAVAQRETAVSLLGQLLENEFDDEVTCAAAEALLTQGSAQGLVTLRERLDEELDEPGVINERWRRRMVAVIAVAGHAGDAEFLDNHYQHQDHEAEALGWHGSILHVERLISTLEERFGGVNVHKFAARSLHRITGAALYLPKSEVDFDAYDLDTTASMWRDWWKQHAEHFTPSVKYRFGIPYTPDATIDELERMNVPQRVRDNLALELAVVTGKVINVRDWWSKQRLQLTLIRSQLSDSQRRSGRFLSKANGS